ncbi:MAG: hypothetical protein DHS20C18_36070 [Saprospiraceae bacterium]|nr:MAG: hypothetical protein DHS20C18_36070 [Saprospiraceae bacterium]
MKIVNLLFFFCCLAFSAQALTITISGTVLDTDGNPVEGVAINIATDSSNWAGYYNQVLTGGDGSYSDTFEVPDNQSQGAIFVSMVDCNGDILFETTYWSPAGTGSVDFTYCAPVVIDTTCYVWIDVEGTGSGAAQLTANTEGQAPFTYAWSTGELTSSIVVLDPGTYCVTITASGGCISTDCVTVQEGGGCGVQISPTPAGLLVAFATGTAPYTYLWSTNETTDAILPAEPGTYCVTVTDASGCESENCFVYGNPNNYDLSGVVNYWDSTGSVVSGWAYLYEASAIGDVELLDSVALVNGGYYSFDDLDAGTYVVRAVLNEDDPGFNDYLPTYYGDVLFWNEATMIAIPYTGNNFFNINLQEAQEPEGPGIISGTIIEGPGFTGDEEVDDRDDTPIEHVTVLLLNENGLAVAYDLTDENGGFIFNNLAWGTYQLIVEIPGLTQSEYWVTIGPEQPTVTDIVFVVTDESITTGTEEWLSDTKVNVFPQPASNQVQIRFELPEASMLQIQIMDSSGKLLMHHNKHFDSGQQSLDLNTSEWAKGLYFYTFRAGKQLLAGKLIKG